MGNSLRNQQHVRPVKQRLSRRERRICFRFLPACCGFVARKIKNLNNNSTHRHFFTMELGKDNLVHDIWRVSIVAVVLVSVFSTFNRSIKCYLPPNRSVSNENVSLFILNSKVLCSLLPHVLRAFWSNIVWVIFKDKMVMYPDCSLNWPSMTALNMGIMIWWWTLRRSLHIRLSTLRPVANDLLNDALRLDNELSALAATCSLRSVSKVQINHLGLQTPL